MNNVFNINGALKVCAQDPLASVVVAEKLITEADGSVFTWPDNEAPRAILWAGANLIPVIPSTMPKESQAAAISDFVSRAKQLGQRCSAISGESKTVLELWRSLKPFWPNPREVRYSQPLFALSEPIASSPEFYPNGQVKITVPAELPLLLPASIAMFTEELGYSPLRFGESAYQQHVASLIQEQRSYRLIADGRVIFKADIGAVAGGVALLQGVWVAPEYRGQGIAKSALPTVISDIQKRIAPTIYLYVNRQNSRAQNLYRTLGFRQIGEVATILF